VSKTVNFRSDAAPDDVRRVFELAIDHGVKGVTVYRDGSRKTQPMALKNEPAPRGGDLPGAVGRLVALALSKGAAPSEVGLALTSGEGGCPECGRPLRREEGCTKCVCGYSRC
jgi:ribonucleotide reductase alpha subunit